jgi:hypothetical protein
VSSEEGTFSTELGHKSQEKNYVIFGPNYFSTVGGRTVQICIVRTVVRIWHKN